MHTRIAVRLASITGSLLIIAGCEGSTDPGQSLRFEALTATSLTAQVGDAIDPGPAVRVIDRSNQPVPGIEVFFVPVNGTRVSHPKVTTGSDGSAAAGTWHLGTMAKQYLLRVEARGLADFEFTAVAAAGPPGDMVAYTGDRQTANTGAALARPLSVVVRDTYGNRVPNAQVTFSVLSGGGSVNPQTVATDGIGMASALWTLGAIAGKQQVRAAVDDHQVVFSAAGCDAICQSFQLLFVRDGRIYRTDTGGSVTQFSSGFYDDSPAVSPDGRRVAYVRHSEFTDPELYVMDISGSNARHRFTNGGSPAWSPDGLELAITGGACLCDLFVISADVGSGPISIVPSAIQPAWSPDGRTIASVTLLGDDGKNALQVSNVDGTGLRDVVARDGMIHDPSWSPDGTRIAFSKCIDGACDIYVARVDGSSIQRLTNTGNAFDPAWSPDGHWIAIVQSEEGEYAPPSIAYIDAVNGGDPIQLQSYGWSPAWIPAATTGTARADHTMILDARGASATRLTLSRPAGQ